MQLGELEVALDIAKASEGTEAKWKQLGELAMSSGRLDVRSLPLTASCCCQTGSTTDVAWLLTKQSPGIKPGLSCSVSVTPIDTHIGCLASSV